MKLELTFVLLLVAAAIAYAAWRVIQAVKAAGDPCRGCAGCALKDARKRNSSKKLVCPDKKPTKNFGVSK